MEEKILVFGKGFLGSVLVAQAERKNIKAFGTNLHEGNLIVDIQKKEEIERVIDRTKPNFIVNCAALTNIDEIEKCPKEAFSINTIGAKNIALVANKKKIPLIHISTDSVFDGKRGMYAEVDSPIPINEYGKTKLEGEKLVLATAERATVVRTNIYGRHPEKKFLYEWIIKNLQNGNSINGFVDVIFNPLEISNVSDMILEIGKRRIFGIIHLASDTVMSKYEFADKIAQKYGFDQELIRKASILDSNLYAPRPLNTSLSNVKAKRLLKTKPIELEDWLEKSKNKFKN